MIRLKFATSPDDDQARHISAFLATPDEKEYWIDSLDEVGLYENETEITNLRDFVERWAAYAELLRHPNSIDKEVEQYGIELAMELQI